MRRRDTIFLCWLLLHRQLLTQPTRGARSAQSRLALPSSECQPSSSVVGTQLTAFSQISAHASGAWRHPNTLVPIPIWDFYFDISEWHTLSARAWTPALMLNLTNPCAKRKVLSLTKLKDKIYKTKSLRHYITSESLLITAQNNVIRTNYVKAKRDKRQLNCKCRLCGDRGETINRIIIECSKLTRKEDKSRHDWVGKMIHRELCKKFKFDHTNKWYMHNWECILENETHKHLWDFKIQTDHLIPARRLNQEK